jgi:hypothetical protein
MKLIVTNLGRFLGEYPKWKLREGGSWFMELYRVDVSDTGNPEPFYMPLVKFENGIIEIRIGNRTLIVFISKWRVQFYVTPHQASE